MGRGGLALRSGLAWAWGGGPETRRGRGDDDGGAVVCWGVVLVLVLDALRCCREQKAEKPGRALQVGKCAVRASFAEHSLSASSCVFLECF